MFVILAGVGWSVPGIAQPQDAEQNQDDPPAILGLDDAPVAAAAAPVDWDDFVEPWKKFSEYPTLAGLLVAFLMATGLGAVIAYHPRSYGKARSLSDVESPKTYIVYALAGALFGQIFAIDFRLGFVLFGLGGLMRFRTDVGAAKDTGRVIVVTCIGLCCGLLRYDIAVISTVFAYGLITILEGGTAYRVVVKGLTEDTLLRSAAAYRKILDDEGCRILNEKKNFVKHTTRFTFRAPRGIDREDLEQLFEDSIPPELKGAAEWQSS